MDVSRTPLPGSPTLRMTRGAGHATCSSGCGCTAASQTLPATAAPSTAVDGVTDGLDVMLPSGVRIRRLRIGAYRVTDAQVLQAARAVQLLPVQDQLLLARTGLPIELLPLRNLEQVAGTSEPVVGATLVDGPPGQGVPKRIRIAANLEALGPANDLGETVQHEIGHVLAVLTRQDRSERAAIAYAAAH